MHIEYNKYMPICYNLSVFFEKIIVDNNGNIQGKINVTNSHPFSKCFRI